jgi:hypothetical protein
MKGTLMDPLRTCHTKRRILSNPLGIMGGVQFAEAAMGGVLMNGVLLFENGLVLSEKEPFPSHSHSVDHRVGLRPRASLDSLNTSYEFLIFFPCWKQVL